MIIIIYNKNYVPGLIGSTLAVAQIIQFYFGYKRVMPIESRSTFPLVMSKFIGSICVLRFNYNCLDDKLAISWRCEQQHVFGNSILHAQVQGSSFLALSCLIGCFILLIEFGISRNKQIKIAVILSHRPQF